MIRLIVLEPALAGAFSVVGDGGSRGLRSGFEDRFALEGYGSSTRRTGFRRGPGEEGPGDGKRAMVGEGASRSPKSTCPSVQRLSRLDE